MKLLVFAHTPPPHHGQSFMVKMVLDGLRADKSGAFEVYHVNARFSDDVGEIGRAGFGKILRAIKFSFQAIRLRLRHGVTNFYYVPASVMRSAVYRDWIVMALCRPFFKRFIFHWQAAGLGEWLAHEARPWERAITRYFLGRPALCVVLGNELRFDGEYLKAKRVEVIPNAVGDPCPNYWQEIEPLRQSRLAARLESAPEKPSASGETPVIFRILYLSLCMREKGLFDAVDAVALANRQLAEEGSPWRVRLTVAGKFYREEERPVFEERIGRPDLNGSSSPENPVVVYRGFVSGDEKAGLFRESDCFCFPSFYPMEGHPVSLVEAMAFGLPVIASRWRALPDLFPADYAGLVEPQAPAQLAEVLRKFMTADLSGQFRQRYESEYTEARFLERLKTALLQVEHERN